MPKKSRITSKQKTARRKNIAVARRAKKKGSGGATAAQKKKAKRLNIDKAASILKSKGVTLGAGSTKLNKSTGKFETKYKFTTKSGKSGMISAKQLQSKLARFL